MYKKLLLFLMLIIPGLLFGQSTISGNVYDFNRKTFPLQDVTVKNLASGLITRTKAGGQFDLAAKSGDLLVFSLPGYHIDTLYLIDLSPKMIYLPDNSTNLKEVAVLGVKVNPSVFVPDFEAKEIKRVQTDGLSGKGNNDRAGGLVFNLGYGKYKKQQEKLKNLKEQDQYEAEINAVFTETYVSDLVKLKGQQLKNFMSLYKPSADLVKSERPFNYSYYTVQAYHQWLKIPEWRRKSQPVPKLKANK